MHDYSPWPVSVNLWELGKRLSIAFVKYISQNYTRVWNVITIDSHLNTLWITYFNSLKLQESYYCLPINPKPRYDKPSCKTKPGWFPLKHSRPYDSCGYSRGCKYDFDFFTRAHFCFALPRAKCFSIRQ